VLHFDPDGPAGEQQSEAIELRAHWWLLWRCLMSAAPHVLWFGDQDLIGHVVLESLVIPICVISRSKGCH
jgi:hypothetical protein